MNEGDVVLTPLPQANGLVKLRPAILLRQMPGFGDWLVCGVSSQLHQAVPGFDDLVLQEHSDYTTSGLKVPSLIRLGFLAVLPSGRFVGVIGSISTERHLRLLHRLACFFAPV